MPATRTSALLRNAARLLGALLIIPLLTACPKGDVGASCNHGDVQPPDSLVVTFPALSCNDLLCVYADSSKAIDDPCTNDAMCNAADSSKNRFQCQQGNCKLSSTYVLERSMCSRTCSSDDDCKDGGIGKKVQAKESNCNSGFSCTEIQKLGEFCCRKLCVCKDDLVPGSLDTLKKECAGFDKDENGDPVCEMVGPPPVTTDPMATATAATATM
jgi:hypothetical protein